MLLVASSLCASPPSVRTGFVIDSKEFKDKLDETAGAREGVENAVSTAIANEAKLRFGFAEWNAEGNATPAAALTLHLIQTPAGGRAEYSLRYSCRIGTVSRELDWHEDPLYAWYLEGVPLRQPDVLQQDVLSRVKSHFGNEAFRKTLYETFLTDIPLTTAAPTVRPSEQKIIVNVPWHSVDLHPDSVVRIDFTLKTVPPNGSDSGSVELTSLDERSNDPGRGDIEGSVVKFVFPPVTTAAGAAKWEPEIATVITPDALQTFKVHLTVYKRRLFDDTQDELASRP